MKPFAYQMVVWSNGEVDFSKTKLTLRAAVESMVALCQPEWVDRGKIAIEAFYENDTSVRVDPHTFRATATFDIDAIRAEVRAAIVKDTAEKAKWLITLMHPVTGSPWLSDFSEDELVEAEVERRQWRWKTMDEIDWVALETFLTR